MRTYLESVLESLRIYFGDDRPKAVCDKLLNLRQNVSHHVKVVICHLLVDNLAKILQADLVSALKLAVVICSLLNRIICQMRESVVQVFERELLTRRPDIPILIEIALEPSIDACKHSKAPEIELALVNQQRVVDVLLYDKRAVSALACLPLDYALNLAESLADVYAIASIRILAWLENPRVLWRSVTSFNLLQSLFFALLVGNFDLASLVSPIILFFVTRAVLIFRPRVILVTHQALTLADGGLFSSLLLGLGSFAHPRLEICDSLLALVVHVLYASLQILKIGLKLGKLSIVSTFGMESQRECLEGVFAERGVVVSHVDKYAFLVCALLVLLKLVVELEGVHETVHRICGGMFFLMNLEAARVESLRLGLGV